jgi:hypothetical protein
MKITFIRQQIHFISQCQMAVYISCCYLDLIHIYVYILLKFKRFAELDRFEWQKPSLHRLYAHNHAQCEHQHNGEIYSRTFPITLLIAFNLFIYIYHRIF